MLSRQKIYSPQCSQESNIHVQMIEVYMEVFNGWHGRRISFGGFCWSEGNVVVFEIDGRLFAKLALYDVYAGQCGASKWVITRVSVRICQLVHWGGREMEDSEGKKNWG